MAMLMTMMVPVDGEPLETVGEQASHRGVGIFLHRDDWKNTALHQAIMQAEAHASGDQDIDSGQRFSKSVVAGVKALFRGKLDKALADDHVLFNLVDPELAALARVLGDGLAILAGNCDFHDASFDVDWLGSTKLPTAQGECQALNLVE
jgi:hypothetical protein